MTGCLYISPPRIPDRPDEGVLPVLIADVVASLTRPMTDAIPILPSTVGVAQSNRSSTIRLVRKLRILGTTAVAMAGDGALIDQCVDEIRASIHRWRRRVRPMRELGQIADRSGLSVIGVQPMPQSLGRIHFVAPGTGEEIPNLGQVRAIGSGQAELLRICREFAPALSEGPDHSLEERVLWFCNALNGRRLAEELVGKAKPDWGGYLEYAAFDFSRRRWRRGPKTINMFFRVRSLRNLPARTPDRDVTVGLIPRAICYDPGGSAGRLLSISRGVDGEHVQEFTIENGSGGHSQLNLGGDRWLGWTPDSVSVTFILRSMGGEFRYVTITAAGSGLVFSKQAASVTFGLTADYVDRLAKDVLDNIGLRYFPSRDEPALPSDGPLLPT